MASTASPGGSGALYLAANNPANLVKKFCRDRHWGPYKGFLENNGLDYITWPLCHKPQLMNTHISSGGYENSRNLVLRARQSHGLITLDAAHNPTGLSMTEDGRHACLDAFVTSALNNSELDIPCFWT